MRLATILGRMTIVSEDGIVDVERASNGHFAASPRLVYERWDEFRAWAQGVEASEVTPSDDSLFGPPSPEPRQVFGIALNYVDHAAESSADVPLSPATFTKFPSAVTGPESELVLPSEFVDWEAELVAVIGRRAEMVRAEDAWTYVAGLTAGQDYSERVVQMTGPMPQFCLGKSFPGFAPTGPVLVTIDEFASPDDLEIECLINGEIMQKERTSCMVFPVPELIARISAICPLLPGDLIFTGTPSGVGFARDPARYLAPGDTVVTRIEGIGELRQTCVAADEQSGLEAAPLRRDGSESS